uniref:50S ribosomal protein L34 n=1 Tax=Lotharella oceanica TaxID=641309 RepID=A0A7S2TK15_9EUKA
METEYATLSPPRAPSRRFLLLAGLFATISAGAIFYAFSGGANEPNLEVPMMAARTISPVMRGNMMPGASRMAASFQRSSLPSMGLSPVVSAPLVPTFMNLDDREDIWVVNNAKRSLGSTIETGTNIKRKKVSGYRARRATPGGRAVLKARRAKGRAVLCPASLRKRCKGGQYSKHSGQQAKPRRF